MKSILLTLSFVLLFFTTQATTIVVDSLNNSGYGSLRAAVDSASNGDTIRFNPNLIALGSDSIVLDSSIVFSKELTFKGLYSATDTLFISGGQNDRIFTIDSTNNIVFDSLVLVNGLIGGNSGSALFENGGAINISICDTLFISNCLFNGNNAANGGAINLVSTYLILNNSLFSNNEAISKGGAINFEHPNPIVYARVSNSIFYNNSAGSSGGAIHSYGTGSDIIIKECILRDNICTQFSGAIEVYVSGNTISSLSILDCTLSKNISEDHGGAIAMYGKHHPILTISHSSIYGNKCEGWAGLGGGIFIDAGDSATLIVNNSTITGNFAERGGGIYAKGSLKVSVQIINSTITGNEANFGGGIYARGVSMYSTDSISILSSIVALNGASNIFGYHIPVIVSQGYNILSFNSSLLLDTIQTDQVVSDSTILNLGKLAFNGGNTRTMMPIFPSIAINNGNPLDSSDAQNAHAFGIREVGAAEICIQTTSIDTIVACDKYTWVNGITYKYSDTGAVFALVNVAGCDSMVTLNLTIKSSSLATDTISTCNQYTWLDGNTYYFSNNIATHTLTNAVGCDSVITLNLTITNTSIDTINTCDSHVWRNGITYYTNNYTAKDTIINTLGCDSIITLHLTLWFNYKTDTIYACDNYTWRDGITYISNNNTALDTLINTAGCDSIVTLNLTLLANSYIDTVSTCDSLTWINGTTYFANNNTAVDTLTNSLGCDSIVTLNLTIGYPSSNIDTVHACFVYTWIDGVFYTSSNNTATHTLTSVTGCDSVVNLDLGIHYGTMGVDTHMVCDSLLWLDGNTYYGSNNTAMYTMSGGNAYGCDSVITLNLTVNSNATNDLVSACGTYTWIDGNTYSASNNIATHLLTNSLGCDSVVTLNLTIPTFTGIDIVTACSTFTWIDGNTFTADNNSATHTLISAAGCDSIVTLNLTMLANFGTEVVLACEVYTWNEITYTSSNTTALDTFLNVAGCDSIVTLNLTILNSTTGTEIITACDSYTWKGITYTMSNNSAKDTLVNAVGCDSIVSLDLTIINSTGSTDVVVTCDSYTWMNGITYSSSANGPTYTLTSAAGCDSIIVLDFTLVVVDTVVVIDTSVVDQALTLTAQATNAKYWWLDCDDNNNPMPGGNNGSFSVTRSGSYSVEVIQQGCIDTSACFSVTYVPYVGVGVAEMELLGISLYPNPTSDFLHIDKGTNQSLDIVITNSAGAEVFRMNSNNQITLIDMSTYATGIYVVSMQNQDGVKIEQVVKR